MQLIFGFSERRQQIYVVAHVHETIPAQISAVVVHDLPREVHAVLVNFVDSGIRQIQN